MTTPTNICDADARVVLGDAYNKFAFARGQMSGGPSDSRFGTGRNGLRDLVQMFDSYANDSHTAASDREQCAKARDVVAGALAALEQGAR